MRKEYNNRHNAPLVNPGFTLDQYEAGIDHDARETAFAMGYHKKDAPKAANKPRSLFIPTIDGVEVAS